MMRHGPNITTTFNIKIYKTSRKGSGDTAAIISGKTLKYLTYMSTEKTVKNIGTL